MYGVQGRTWVALGDPVGPPEQMGRSSGCSWNGATTSVAWRCSTRSRASISIVTQTSGSTFVKLGEEARVDLTAFTLEGSQAKKYRQVIHRLEREQATFRIVPPEQVPG